MPTRIPRPRPSPSRRAPVQGRALQTVDAILQATAQVLVKDGEAALTTNRIAERAGVSVGTLYQYFPDKQAVFRALLDAERQHAVATLDAWLVEVTQRRLGVSAAAEGIVSRAFEAFAGRTPARRKLARFLWRQDSDETIALALRATIERIAVRLQDASGSAVPLERLFVVTRAVLGTLRYASLEASPLVASGALEPLLVEMSVSMMTPMASPRRRPRRTG
ncbi:MAG: TetR/AcrR family transcriptional regulator [Rubrivivax sp.]|nr:TetR/AcrR family transcriptional regulator [Rubrivivax sp.]